MTSKLEFFLARMREARAFHRLVQAEWKADDLELKGDDEFPLRKDSGRPGRADVHVRVEADHIAFIEIKHTFWDGKPERNIRRLIMRYARQLYSYMDGSDLSGKAFEKLDKTLGIVFPKRPKTEGLAEFIEEGFGEYGIQVVWHDVA
jgi:hypothetical protein